MKSVMVRDGLSVVAYPIGGTPYDVGVGHLAGLYVVREMHVHESILLRACANWRVAALNFL
jgi:hypothetical protein